MRPEIEYYRASKKLDKTRRKLAAVRRDEKTAQERIALLEGKLGELVKWLPSATLATDTESHNQWGYVDSPLFCSCCDAYSRYDSEDWHHDGCDVKNFLNWAKENLPHDDD